MEKQDENLAQKIKKYEFQGRIGEETARCWNTVKYATEAVEVHLEVRRETEEEKRKIITYMADGELRLTQLQIETFTRVQDRSESFNPIERFISNVIWPIYGTSKETAKYTRESTRGDLILNRAQPVFDQYLKKIVDTNNAEADEVFELLKPKE